MADDSSIFVLSPEQARKMDRLCAERYGIPTAVLMENAGVQVANAAGTWQKTKSPSRVLIVAGTGNNGGDALVAARHLFNAGQRVAILLVGDPKRLSADAAAQWRTCRAMKIPSVVSGSSGSESLARALKLLASPTRGPDVIIAGLFGTGLSRPVTGVALEVIDAVNELKSRGSRVVAVDLPSGMHAATGEILGAAIEPDITVTFVALKQGMLHAVERLGTVLIADIGVPRQLVEKLAKPVSPKRRSRS